MDIFLGKSVSKIREENKLIKERVDRLEASINGESEWFLVKKEKDNTC